MMVDFSELYYPLQAENYNGFSLVFTLLLSQKENASPLIRTKNMMYTGFGGVISFSITCNVGNTL
jgi:hypothetical protein